MGQRTVHQIQDWSKYLRTVSNNLIGSNLELANHFFDVHYVIGPKNMTESNPFRLNTEYLGFFEKCGKPKKEIMREFIKTLKIVICEGDKLRPEIMNQSVWNSGLRNYLCELKGYLECRLAKSSAKRSGVISKLCRMAAFILFFLSGFFVFGKHEPRILLALGCLLPAIIFAFYSLEKQRNS